MKLTTIVEKIPPEAGRISCEAHVNDITTRWRAHYRHGVRNSRCLSVASYNFLGRNCCTLHARMFALNYLLENERGKLE